jgi:hypothetical protein
VYIILNEEEEHFMIIFANPRDKIQIERSKITPVQLGLAATTFLSETSSLEVFLNEQGIATDDDGNVSPFFIEAMRRTLQASVASPALPKETKQAYERMHRFLSDY